VKRLSHHIGRAQLQLPSGDVEALMRELEGMLRAGSTVYHCEVWALALMGDLDRAESIAFYGASDARQVCAGITLAIAAWKRGDHEEALRALSRYQLAVADYYRGEIFAEQGRHREAVERFRQYRLHRGLQFYEGFYDWWNYPRSLYLEAVSLEALGERDEARRLLKRLLHLWERADPGYPLLAEARVMERRLAASR
jgi:tetratricopeptide (TPR) repeat protein